MKRLLAVVSVFLLLAPTALGATWTNATWSADAENVILAKLHATEQQFCGFTRTETRQLETLAKFKTADMVYRDYQAHAAPDGWGTDDGARNAGISTGVRGRGSRLEQLPRRHLGGPHLGGLEGEPRSLVGDRQLRLSPARRGGDEARHQPPLRDRVREGSRAISNAHAHLDPDCCAQCHADADSCSNCYPRAVHDACPDCGPDDICGDLHGRRDRHD
jgi:hypothetical protein